MRKSILNRFLQTATVLISMFFGIASAHAADVRKYEDPLQNSGKVIRDVVEDPEGIPEKLLGKADCVIVIPAVSKIAFVDRGSYGRGAMTCRIGENRRSPWGAPTMMTLGAGSSATQLGARTVDFVLLVMNPRGVSSILSRTIRLGADASVSAGPVGVDAEADPNMNVRVEILAYRHSRGIVAGVSLKGCILRADNDANERIYQKRMSAREIALHDEVLPPQSAELLIDTLCQHSPAMGIASWYGGWHQGLKMANGQRFDRRELTAASWDFPLGTVVRVVNVENGDSVIVRITDRGPSHTLHRIIDLSEAAAQQLDYVKQGITQVFLYPVPPDSNRAG